MQKILFISGVPGTGKTTLAYEMALKYKIDKVVSLDILKICLKTYINNDYINTTTHEAYKIENVDVITGYQRHCKIINSYFVNIIKGIKDNSMIVEGATVTEEFIKQFEGYECHLINLYVDDKEVLLNRYKEKMKVRKSNWIQNINEIMIINEYLKDNSSNNVNITRRVIDESMFL